MKPSNRLTFAWWNLHNFSHYDATRRVVSRWPKKLSDYEAKRDRILQVVAEFHKTKGLDVFAACELTREAARDLLTKLPSDFDVATAPDYPDADEFQVAIFYRTDMGLRAELPLLPSLTEDVTRETRPMLAVHLTIPGHVIRFVACHWTGLDEKSSRTARIRLADFLRRDTYKFLCPEAPDPGVARHVVVLGDLNEEPMADVFKHALDGRRDRKSCRDTHWRDAGVRRIRLYNLAWRYLGEQDPHGVGRPLSGGAAGTWYDGHGVWRTLDHVLVSGGLLGEHPPYLDEENTRVVSLPILQDKTGVPTPFEAGSSFGVSDHLPILGQLILREPAK
jgi:endonuclease/exonuclease/phosphatase family metal-dependent hydrolase